MPIAPQDRPLAALREDTIDRLIVNYAHGKLSRAAFERRLDDALDAATHEALLSLTADLTLGVDARYERAKAAELGTDGANASAAESPHEPGRNTGSGTGGGTTDRLVHVFGGTNRRGRWLVPAHLHIVNVFGGCELDFTEARFASPVTRIRLFCLFGGASLLVSEQMNVVSTATCIFGGIDNRASSSADPAAPTIELEGVAVFGGASVKIKRTLKEHWLGLAASVRSLFDPAR